MSDTQQKEVNINLDIRNKIYTKSYRLVAAIFIVLKVVEDEGQLKTRIKDLAMEMLSLISSLKNRESIGTVKDIEKNSTEIISLLEVASMSGLFSEMNSSILKNEFMSFNSDINILKLDIEREGGIAVKATLDQDPLLNFLDRKEKLETHSNYIRQIESPLNAKMSEKIDMGHTYKNGELKNGKRKDVRRNLILDYIRNNEEVSIKDIIPNVKGCSEKTIQRELVALINENKILRKGDRRWSKYSAII